MTLVYTMRLAVESFFAMVFAGAVLAWLYNRYLSELRESYLKKGMSLAVLPLAVLAGIGHGAAMARGVAAPWWAVLPGVVFFVVKCRSVMLRRRLNRVVRTRFLMKRGSGLNYRRFSPLIRFCLYMFKPFNDVDRLQLVEREVPIEGLHRDLEGLRLVFLTDFHVHPTLKMDFYQQVVEEALALEPDVVLVGGDFVSKGRWRRAPREALAGLARHRAVYTVRGNHDFWNWPSYFAAMVEDWGGQLISNDYVTITRGEGRLVLAGLEHPYIPLTPRAEERLRRSLGDDPRVALVHTPEAFAMARRLGCQFAVAGHTHGGQIRLPFFGTTVASATLPERLVWGAGELRGMPTQVSNGIGAFFPLRTNCPPQIILLELKSGVPAQGADFSEK